MTEYNEERNANRNNMESQLMEVLDYHTTARKFADIGRIFLIESGQNTRLPIPIKSLANG